MDATAKLEELHWQINENGKGAYFSNWEHEFVESKLELATVHGEDRLTGAQLEKIDEIWSKAIRQKVVDV